MHQIRVREACSKSSSKVSGVYLETFLAPSATSDSHDPLLKNILVLRMIYLNLDHYQIH